MATQQDPFSRRLDLLLADLKSRNEDVRFACAKRLAGQLARDVQEMPPEAFTKLNDALNRRFFELVNTGDPQEKLGAIQAIDELIDVEADSTATKITRFANCMRIALPASDLPTNVLATRVLGHLARAGGTLTSEFVEFEIRRAFEWLQGDAKAEYRRHAAVLILKEMAENAPTLLYGHATAPVFWELLFGALRDVKPTVREVAGETLGAVLRLISQRNVARRTQWYVKIFDEADSGVKSGSTEVQHGSLIMLQELLRCSGNFLESKFSEVCEMCMRHKDSKDRNIRRTVLQIIPLLASLSVEFFLFGQLSPAMNHLLNVLKKDSDKGPAFQAIGDLCKVLGKRIIQWLDTIANHIKDVLNSKQKKLHDAALNCVSMIASGLGSSAAQILDELLDSILQLPVSQQVVDVLTEIATNVDVLLPKIQSCLLDRLSVMLAGVKFRQLNAASTVNTAAPVSGGDSSTDPSSIAMAIRTLSTFDFTGFSLMKLVAECVIKYLDSDNAEIRLEAARACSKLLIKPDVAAPVKGEFVKVVAEVVEKLLIIGIADPDPVVRIVVLESLDWRFDRHLVQAENLRSLFIALNDEDFSVRKIAIGVIGRLIVLNPAYVMPSLRKTLIQLLTTLEYSADARSKEESAILLAALIESARNLIKPYVRACMLTLLPRLKDPSHSVVACVLNALGALAEVGGKDMIGYMDTLMPVLITTLQDQSNVSKREMALRTLGKLVSSTGDVIAPYTKFPELLPTLLVMLESEHGSLRMEVVRVIGILGALDPYTHKTNVHRQEREQRRDPGDGGPGIAVAGSDIVWGVGTASDSYYPSVVFNELMRILKDPGLSAHHQNVVQAVMYIFKSIGMRCVPFLPIILPPFLDLLKGAQQSNSAYTEFLFQQLGVLVSVVKQHIKDYMEEIFVLIQNFWKESVKTIHAGEEAPLLNKLIVLVEELSTALIDELKAYLPKFIPQLLNVLQTDRTGARSATLKCLHALEVFGPQLDSYLHIVLPAMVKLFEAPDVPAQVASAAITTLGSLCKKLKFADYASGMIHPLVRVLESGSDSLKKDAMETICALVQQLGPDFAVFVPVIDKVMARQRLQHVKYSQLVHKLMKNPNMSFQYQSDYMGGAGVVKFGTGVDMDHSDALSIDIGKMQRLRVNQQMLRRSWETKNRSTRGDWEEWYRRVSVEILKESPSPPLRACWAVAQVYPPLARELFNPAFVSCWTELSDLFQDELVQSLETALESPALPPEILQILLNLAEFMEHDDKALPIDIRQLGALAERCHAYAKALHYKEIEFRSSPIATIEALISITNKLHQPEAAEGILRYAEREHITTKETWHEELGRWQEALDAYEKKQEEMPNSDEYKLGRMRCLHALGEWEQLAKLGAETWPRVDAGSVLTHGGQLAGSSGSPAGSSVMGSRPTDEVVASRSALHHLRAVVAPLAAAAEWNLGRWDQMEAYVQAIPENSVQGAFLRSVLALHKNDFHLTARLVDLCRDLLINEVIATVGESYNRAYGHIVIVQQLAELEEIMRYKQVPEKDPVRAEIQKTWMKRLEGMQRDVEVWQRILAVRSLVLSPHEDARAWLKFSSLCLKSGRLQLSRKSLLSLLGFDPATRREALPLAHPEVSLAYLKHLWTAGEGKAAVDELREYVARLCKHVNPNGTGGAGLSSVVAMVPSSVATSQQQPAVAMRPKVDARIAGTQGPGVHVHHHYGQPAAAGAQRSGAAHPGASGVGSGGATTAASNGADGSAKDAPSFQHSSMSSSSSTVSRRLLARSFLRLGTWEVALREDGRLTESLISSALESFQRATEFDPEWQKAWRAWAVMNFEVIQSYEQQPARDDGAPPSREDIEAHKRRLFPYVVPAINGFFKSVALGKGQSLQDTLRLLTLWFSHGGLPEVQTALSEGFNTVSIDTWLQVIPQIIARISTPSLPVRRLIHDLLTRVGREHPQALVYPLTVASKSGTPARREAAESIIEIMRQHSAVLVNQALVVSQELIRVAVLWPEQWHEGLEEASRQYFGNRNVEGMFGALAPLHALMEKGAQTIKEQSFEQAFGRDLQEALEWCKRYMRSRKISDVNQAWDLYYYVFRRINKELPLLTMLELQYVSPALLESNDLELAVPGTYVAGKPICRIAKFDTTLQVINSKQRPRKFSIMGTDGQRHTYVLKGHEDMRQDERVMQLFGLVNTLLAVDRETARRHLVIERYPVLPLSPTSGLLGWVPHSDTMNTLIKAYRESKKMHVNAEHRLISSMTASYDGLTLVQKLEVFEKVLKNTREDDLANVLWLKSKDSEVWLDRRGNYTQSLAVMSMVGYILGLGDRHPSNLMMNKFTGKILHIDFGDCFEVAMTREKFPEKIPFRLTRMLIYAMEVCGIEGSFRITCELVMRVLRDNRDSLMAVLEAFVHDPLINWRLLAPPAASKIDDPQQKGANFGAMPPDSNKPPKPKNPREFEDYAKHAELPPERLPSTNATNDDEEQEVVLNERAVSVIARVKDKLTGRDFDPSVTLGIPEQVQKLIAQATDNESNSQSYVGWCAWW